MLLLTAEKLVHVFNGSVPPFTGRGTIAAPPVHSVTLEDILKSLEADQVIMKIDVEGSECQVSAEDD